jgi:hypothetical protein
VLQVDGGAQRFRGPSSNPRLDLEEVSQVRSNVVPCDAKADEGFVFGTVKAGGVRDRPMKLFDVLGEDRTNLFRTQGDDLADAIVRYLVSAFRILPGDVDSDLRHCDNREGVQFAGLGAGAMDADTAGHEGPRDPFGELAAGRIRDTQEEHVASVGIGFGQMGAPSGSRGTLRRVGRKVNFYLVLHIAVRELDPERVDCFYIVARGRRIQRAAMEGP